VSLVAAPLEIRTVISSQMGAVGSGTAAIGVVGSPSIKDGLAVLLWRVVMPSPPQLNQDVLLARCHWVQPASTLCTESVSF